MRFRPFGALAMLLLVSGAGAHAQSNPNATRILETVEQRLLDAKDIEIYAYVDLKEPFVRRLQGPIKIDSAGKITADLFGSIGPDNAKLKVDADGEKLRLTLNDDTKTLTQPKGLRESFLVSLVRFGIGDSLIAFSQLKAPERSDQNMREWIKVDNVQLREGAVAQGYHAGEIALQFSFTLDGKPGGFTRLWISTQSGLPVRREQFINYIDADGKSAQMRSDERYTSFIADP